MQMGLLRTIVVSGFVAMTSCGAGADEICGLVQDTYDQAFDNKGDLIRLLDKINGEEDVYIGLLKDNASEEQRHKVRLDMSKDGLAVLSTALAREVAIGMMVTGSCFKDDQSAAIKRSNALLLDLAKALTHQAP